MQKLAAFVHGKHFEGQTSSATFHEIYEILQSLCLPKNTSFLDLGCGNGSFTRKISKKFGFKTIGVDLSQQLVNQANQDALLEKISGFCKFYKDDFVTLSTLREHEKFGGLISIGSLYWNQPLKQTLSTWEKHVEDQGYLIIFLNLIIKDLTNDEQKRIGKTKFIYKSELEEILFNGFKSYIWEDRTSTYISWLKKWCEGMNRFQKEIYQEMGSENALLLFLRFQTYLKLALQKKVLREVIVMKKRHAND